MGIVFAVALLLAGCSGPATDEGRGESRGIVSVSWDVLWADCPCFEPSIAVGPDGTLYATHGYGDQILVKPPGADAEVRSAPLPPWSGPATGFPGDAFVQTDAQGRLYYHTLLVQPGVFGPLALLGIQIAISEDGGETWPVNTFLGTPDDEGALQLGADRQWLTIAPDGTLHMVYQRHANSVYAVPRQTQDTAVMHARSTDGGATWSGFAPVSVPATAVINGQPIVTAGGALIVPYFAFGAAPALYVTVSRDGGETFGSHEVFTGGDGPGADFPSLAASPDGRLFMVWRGPDDALRVTSSDDEGATWADSVVWNDGDQVDRSPWALVDGGRLQVLWFSKEADPSAQLHLSHAPLSSLDAPHDRDLEAGNRTGSPTHTDFAHGVVASDGTLYTVRADPESRRLLVYRVTFADPDMA